jgi:hypothetical protein
LVAFICIKTLGVAVLLLFVIKNVCKRCLIQNKNINFAAMKPTTRRQFASWVLLAVFVPMLLLSSLHVHGVSTTDETPCAECVQHQCHGHLAQLSFSVHQCVLCQFLVLSFVAAPMLVVMLGVAVCRKLLVQPLCSIRVACCGAIVTRGPPSCS